MRVPILAVALAASRIAHVPVPALRRHGFGVFLGALVLLGLTAMANVFDARAFAKAFFLHFATTWLIVWATANGPLRIALVRWRYRGGRVV